MLLLFGLLFYLTIRDTDSVYGWPASAYFALGSSDNWSAWTGALPSFLHVIAMALMTYAVTGMGKSHALLAASCWVIVDSLFEIAQHEALSSRLINWIPDWFDVTPLLDNLRPHLQRGTFDPIDLIAIISGGMVAWYAVKVFESKRGWL